MESHSSLLLFSAVLFSTSIHCPLAKASSLYGSRVRSPTRRSPYRVPFKMPSKRQVNLGTSDVAQLPFRLGPDADLDGTSHGQGVPALHRGEN